MLTSRKIFRQTQQHFAANNKTLTHTHTHSHTLTHTYTHTTLGPNKLLQYRFRHSTAYCKSHIITIHSNYNFRTYCCYWIKIEKGIYKRRHSERSKSRKRATLYNCVIFDSAAIQVPILYWLHYQCYYKQRI